MGTVRLTRTSASSDRSRSCLRRDLRSCPRTRLREHAVHPGTGEHRSSLGLRKRACGLPIDRRCPVFALFVLPFYYPAQCSRHCHCSYCHYTGTLHHHEKMLWTFGPAESFVDLNHGSLRMHKTPGPVL